MTNTGDGLDCPKRVVVPSLLRSQAIPARTSKGSGEVVGTLTQYIVPLFPFVPCAPPAVTSIMGEREDQALIPVKCFPITPTICNKIVIKLAGITPRYGEAVGKPTPVRNVRVVRQAAGLGFFTLHLVPPLQSS